MVSRVAHALTKIGFRRDVRLFLTVLFGFLSLLILILLTLLQTFILRAETAVWDQWTTVAEHAASEIAAAGPTDPATLRTRLVYLTTRHHIAGIEVIDSAGRRTSIGGETAAEIVRETSVGRIRLRFDPTEIERLRMTFRWTAIITITATFGGVILLLFYLPRITKPVEEVLEQAKALGDRAEDVDEDRYLIETFRNSIATLKLQEAELRRLHDLQKSRADDLERVTDTLTRSINSGFVAVDDRGLLVDVNQAAREILRLEAQENVAGRTIDDTLGERPFASALERASNEHLSLSRIEVHEAGEQVIGLTTVPLQRESGDYLGLLAIFTDLTPIRTLEDRVRQLQTLAELGEMAAGVAHEFRNSLGAILGYLRLAERQKQPDEIVIRLRKAEEEANELAAAVERLLNFARPLDIERRPVNLGNLARAIAQRLVPEDIELIAPDSDVQVDADAALLQRAIENVIRNSIDAIRETGRRGTIEITAQATPLPRLRICDTGSGIEESEIARVFVPFHSTKPNGFGMGLPLARKIALLHGGTISVSSRRGEGTCVTMELPLGEMVQFAPVSASTQAPSDPEQAE